MARDREQHNVAFMVGVLLGALGGAVGTLLLTPLSGQQTREQLNGRLGGAGVGGMLPGGRVPTHLDGGTYARDGGGQGLGGKVAALKDRVQSAVGDAAAAARDRAPRAFVGDGDPLAPGDQVTFTPVTGAGLPDAEAAERR